MRVGRHFQEVVIAGLTVSAGLVAHHTLLIVFGLLIALATALKEIDILSGQKSKIKQWCAYILFIVGYIGGGTNFIWTFFKPEFQDKAFLGLALLSVSYVVKGIVEYWEKTTADT